MSPKVILAIIALSLYCVTGQPTAAPVACPAWTYSEGPYSPPNWATACPAWSACALNRQSPINIVANTTKESSLTPLKAAYTFNTGHSIVNNGYTLKINIAEGSAMTVSGGPLPTNYKLLQIHLHTKSEHTFAGVHSDLEVHLVHGANITKGEYAVVGVMFHIVEDAAPNPFLQKVDDMTPLLQTPDVEHDIDFDPAELARLVTDNPYFTYNGSFTTPPCSEIVQWIVMEDVHPMTFHQLAALKSVASMVDNFRPVQPLMNRTISVYRPPVIVERKGAPIGVVLGIIACGLVCFVGLGIAVLMTTKVGTSEKDEYEDIKTGDGDDQVELEDQEVL